MDTSLTPDPKTFKHRYKMSLLGMEKRKTPPERRQKTALAHVSTYERANKVLEEGIKSENDARCLVMASTILPLLDADDIDLEIAIRKCKDRGIYLWDDAGEAIHQSLATVGVMKEDNPAVLIVNADGLSKDHDPAWTAEDADDPISYVHQGKVDKDRIECVCTLREDLIPDIGAAMCPVVTTNTAECPSSDATDPDVYKALHNPDNWTCVCKAGKVNDDIQDRVMNEITRRR